MSFLSTKRIPKKDPPNYRPVSLTYILGKIYEKFLRVHILNQVEEKINSHRHGFVNRKSCLSYVLETVGTIIKFLEEGYPVVTCTLIFAKLFHTTGW